jgi:F-type H+-transporting ATPase subunit delta
MKVLGGSSRASVLTLRKSLAQVVDKQSANDAAVFASDLFVILSVLSTSIGVRRALTDNSRDHSLPALPHLDGQAQVRLQMQLKI